MTADNLDNPRDTAKIIATQRLNLHHLFIFYAVAQHSSFSKAAIALEITQPAVSIQINELETALGTQLFHRRSRNLRVTDTGKIVLRYAEHIFTLSNDLIQNIEEIKGLNAGNLTIGGAIKGCRLVQKVIGESHNTAAPFRTVLTAGQYARFITDGVCTIQRIVE